MSISHCLHQCIHQCTWETFNSLRSALSRPTEAAVRCRTFIIISTVRFTLSYQFDPRSMRSQHERNNSRWTLSFKSKESGASGTALEKEDDRRMKNWMSCTGGMKARELPSATVGLRIFGIFWTGIHQNPLTLCCIVNTASVYVPDTRERDYMITASWHLRSVDTKGYGWPWESRAYWMNWLHCWWDEYGSWYVRNPSRPIEACACWSSNDVYHLRSLFLLLTDRSSRQTPRSKGEGGWNKRVTQTY